MKISKAAILVLAVAAGALVMVNCKQKAALEPAPAAGTGERAGAAMDRAAEKTTDKAKESADKTREIAGEASEKTQAAAEKAAEKTGEVMEEAGEAVANAGENLQE